MASRDQDERQCLPVTEALWNKALEALRPDDREQLLSTRLGQINSLDSLLSEIRMKRDMAHSKRWKFKRSDGTAILMRDVFEKILGSVSRYTQSIGILANADPVHAGLPWGVCRFLLQVSTSDLEAFGSLSEGIEVVTGVLYRYQILEDVCFSPLPSSRDDARLYLSGCIIKVYTAVLNYLATAKKYWSHNTASRIARSLARNLEAEHQALALVVSIADEEAFKTASLFQMRELFDISEATKAALTTVVDELRGPLIRIAQDVSQLHHQLQHQERLEVFRWLSTVPCEAHHKQSCKKILDGTGRWLLESPTFLEWQKSSASALFWLNGTPGSGKSKLSSIVIQSLLEKQTLAQSQKAPLAYFYCSQKSTDPRTADSREILCAVLRQLTSRDSATPLRGTVGEDFRQRKETADNNGAQITPLDIEETVEHILAITKEDSVTIILDALDEVDEERSDLFEALERIVQASDNVVKVFVSSRRDGDVVERFDQCAQVRIGDHMTKHDMERFIHHKVTEAITTRKMLRGRVSPSLRDDIIETLNQRAHGM